MFILPSQMKKENLSLATGMHYPEIIVKSPLSSNVSRGKLVDLFVNFIDALQRCQHLEARIIG
jgi:hypothetical protein